MDLYIWASMRSGEIHVEVYLGTSPLLEAKIGLGLIEFGLRNPNWRFTMRRPDFHFTPSWLKEHDIRGVLAVVNASDISRTLKACGIPWVHLFPDAPGPYPSVNVDDQMVGRMGADFFLRKGFLRCAFCGVGTPWSERRAVGFMERIREAGREATTFDIAFDRNQDWGFAHGSAEQLWEWVTRLEPGLAVMTAHDTLANRLADFCRQRGLRVPQDVAILGVGNHELLCRLSNVPISSVDTSVSQATQRAADILKDGIEGRRMERAVWIPPQEIVERRSTEIEAYADDLVAEVVGFIRNHIGEGLRVEDLLANFPVSRRTLSRRFARYVGHSPAEEIRRVRLEYAQELIEQGHLSLTEIAARCHYADLGHMDRTFRKTLNTTPGALRQRR